MSLKIDQLEQYMQSDDEILVVNKRNVIRKNGVNI